MTSATDLTAPFVSTVLHVAVAPGEFVAAGTILVMLESMKMEHPVEAVAPGRVDAVLVTPGDTVQPGDVLLRLRDTDGFAPGQIDESPTTASAGVDRMEGAGAGVVGAERPELTDLRARVDATLDAGRPAATERRHGAGRRTAARTSRTSATPGASRSTGRWWWRPSGPAAAART